MGATALLFAVENNHKNVVDVLLEYGADTSIALHTSGGYHEKFNVGAGDTPLHAAARIGNVAIIRSLLRKHADINAANSKQEKPVNVAQENSESLTALTLCDYSEKIEHLVKKPGRDHQQTAFFSPLYGFFGNKTRTAARFSAPTKICVGTPIGKKQAATNALKNVMFNNADISSLDAHKEALDNGKLKSIYANLNQLKVLAYSKKINDLVTTYDTNHQQTSFNFFGRKIGFGTPIGKKQAAVNALKSVIFDGAENSTLEAHKEAFDNGELKSIYRSFKIK